LSQTPKSPPKRYTLGMSDTITLNDALKLTGITETGGQAKLMIQAGEVKVNGEVETRRKRKLVAGDVLEVAGEEFELELEDN